MSEVREKVLLAATKETLPMPPWGIDEQVTLYRMKRKKAGENPVEYEGKVVEIGGPRKIMVGKNRGKRFREI